MSLGLWRFSYAVLWFIIPIFCRVEVRRKEYCVNLEGPLIIAANHISWFDSVFLAAAIPAELTSSHGPIRLLVAYRFTKIPVLNAVLRAYGALPVRRSIGLEHSLEQPCSILKSGGMVGIFPEGGVSGNGRLKEGKRGAAFLALRTGARIVPVGLSGTRALYSPFSFMRRPRVIVFFGEPFFVEETELSKATAAIMRKIKNTLPCTTKRFTID